MTIHPRSCAEVKRKWIYTSTIGFGGLGVECWPLVPKFAGSNPAEAVGFFRAKKSSTRLPSERKWNIPKLTWKSEFRQNYRTISRPRFHLSLLGSLVSLRTYRHLTAKVGASKVGGKQWQTTPKNLPRIQCARATPVTWLGSGSCQPGL